MALCSGPRETAPAIYGEAAGVEELLPDSVEDLAVLSLVGLGAESDFESFESLESEEESELEEEEPSLEPFLLSDGGLGRP